ncbi:MAG TPA: glutamine amidotransferase [Verrucomicrobiae bacterium]|nr:glutamine amidotransferase [Verrucomicrobiae bacterium]
MTGSIIFAGQAWLLPAVGTVIVLAAALVWAGHRGAAERRVRIGCGLLKFAGIVLLALILLDPLWVSQRARPGANVFALLADNSQSLKMKDPDESQSRGTLLRKTLTGDADGWQSSLEKDFQVRRYTFDSRLQGTRDFSELNFDGRASALGNALKTAMEHWRGQPVAGVLLFTDGNATDLGQDLPSLAGCPPIYPVVLGSDKSLPDISLERVHVSQTSFEDAPVTIQADVAATGFAGQKIVARLTEVAIGRTGTNQSDSLRISSASNAVVQLSQRAADSTANLNFRFQIEPAGPGLHFYELEARSQAELENSNAPSPEATLVNNRQMIVVDRGQEPFRVLYVGGEPTWEFKFLNRAIEDDPQVRMVSLIRVAKREPKFQFEGRAGESSNPLYRGFGNQGEDTGSYDKPVIIRLNTKDEYELRDGFPKTPEELYRYQAVILGDVEAAFFTHEQQALLQRFVSDRGGGFLMLGGADSFRQGGYAGTPIASMLPVYLDRPTDATLPSMWKLTLTRDGWLQPWTRLRETESEEKTRLNSMPPFEVFNPVDGIKPGASVLATVSDPGGKTYPALAAQRFGLGRSAALMIGDMYHWGFQDEANQKDLAKSWRQLVRWLVSDVPRNISVSAEPAADGNPAEVRLIVKAHDAKFQPLDDSTVRLTVRPVQTGFSENDDGTNNLADTNFVQLTAEPSADQPGTYEATYVAHDTGAYSVEAMVTQPDGKVAGRAAAGWTSDPAVAEFRALKPNRALLETIAKKTGGQIVSLSDLNSFVRSLPARHAPITETWSEPLWDKPVVFLLALACFVAEWGIRRWKGLP